MDVPHLDAPGADRPGVRARLSLSALAHNLPLARAAARPPAVPALAADAWGHGTSWVHGVLVATDTDADGIDPLTLYGLPGGDPDARPVMRLTGQVLSTKPLRAGEGVSYGYAHRAPEDTSVALVRGGYAQGIVRMLGNRVHVRVRAAERPLIGRIAMDVCVVDIGALEVERGEEVVFFGDPRDSAPSLAAWVHATGWTSGELVALVGARVPREVVA